MKLGSIEYISAYFTMLIITTYPNHSSSRSSVVLLREGGAHLRPWKPQQHFRKHRVKITQQQLPGLWWGSRRHTSTSRLLKYIRSRVSWQKHPTSHQSLLCATSTIPIINMYKLVSNISKKLTFFFHNLLLASIKSLIYLIFIFCFLKNIISNKLHFLFRKTSFRLYT